MLNHFNNAGMFIECLPVSQLLESNANLNLCFVGLHFLSFSSFPYNQECHSTGLISHFSRKSMQEGEKVTLQLLQWIVCYRRERPCLVVILG